MSFQYFIDQGVDLSPQDRWGGTPLDDARRHGQEQVVQLLETAVNDRLTSRVWATVTPLRSKATGGEDPNIQ